ncbi:MAG TPA: hypothetical protein VGK23_10125 [Methanomassiliicoccales archaeon]|jgi:hypothetical protein
MKMNIEDTVAEVSGNLKLMIQDMDSGSHVPRPLPLDRLKNWAREGYQEIYREQALTIIGKLNLNEPVSADESKLVEEWMVGDIELYWGIEVHYEEWKKEVLDLIARLEGCDHPDVKGEVKCLLDIQAVIIELEHVLRDIDHYRYGVDRIRRFRTFVGRDINNMTHEDKVKLAEYMKSMVYSDSI